MYGRLRAVGADVLGCRAVAVDVGVAHLCGRAEFDGNGHADVLADRKDAAAVFDAVAKRHAGRNHSVSAAFCHGEPGFRIGRDGDGDAYAYGRHLIRNGRAGLIFGQVLRNRHKKKLL